MECDKTDWERLKEFKNKKHEVMVYIYPLKGRCEKGEKKRKRINRTVARQFGYKKMDRKAKFWITRFNKSEKPEQFTFRDFHNFRHNYKAAV